jgi:glycosyltransferase involved in cell wall biosynthesis
MKIGIIIPHRGDRERFLTNCWRMIQRQTLKPFKIELVNDLPLNDDVDITWRYRMGYDRLRNIGVDVIAFMENDDWYAPEYLETMAYEWRKHGRPDIFGTNYTIYYHIKLKKYFTMNHTTRASAMNTLIKPDLKIKWPIDKEPYTDSHLWIQLKHKGIVFKPEKHISIGIKHGDGLTGGHMHRTRMYRYNNDDNGFLKETLDPESFEFYNNYFEKQVVQ